MLTEGLAQSVTSKLVASTLDDFSSGLGDWSQYRVTDGLLGEWAFSEGSGNSVADNSGNGNPIDLTLPASQSFTWQDWGVRTAGGLVETPALTGSRTFVALARWPHGSSGFGVSGGNLGSGGGLFTGAAAQVTTEVRVGRNRGIAPVIARPLNGTRVLVADVSGWALWVMDYPASFNTALAVGGRQGQSSSRLAQCDVAYAATFSGTLSDAQCDSLHTLARALLLPRGEYLDWRDCPSKANLVLCLGDSQLEGRSMISNLSAADQLRTTPANVYIRNDGEAVGAATALVMGSNQQDDDAANDFGPEMGLAWKFEDNSHSSPLYIVKGAVGGSKFSVNAATPTDTTRWAIDPWNDNTASPWNNTSGGGVGDGRLHQIAHRLWEVEANLLNAGVGPKLLAILHVGGQNDGIVESESLTYQSDFTEIIARVRLALASDSLPVVIARTIDNDPVAPHTDNVRAAQAAIAAADSNVQWFDCDDLSQQVDTHFDAAGSKLLGERLYDRIAANLI